MKDVAIKWLVRHACLSCRLVLAQTLVIHSVYSELSHGGCFTSEKAKKSLEARIAAVVVVCHENCHASSENVAKVLRPPHKTTFNTLQNTSECTYNSKLR